MSPGRRLRGATRVPGDKSIAHRALILAGMAGSDSTITGVPDGQDVLATRRCLQALGVVFEGGKRTLRVRPPQEFRPGHVLDAGNSGTTARLLAGALASRRCAAEIVGDASLTRRPMERVAAPLRALGAQVDTTGGCLPLRVRPAVLHATSWAGAVPSAQVKSAFLLAALGASGESAYAEAAPTRDHLERMLPAFGVTCGVRPGGEFRLRGARPSGGRVAVPGDASSAATLLIAAAMLPGSDVVIEGACLNPLRMGFVSVLERMGVPVVVEEERGPVVPEPVGTLRVTAPGELAPVTVESHETPSLIDELPMLLLAAARARGVSRFAGIAELRLKESDRLQAMSELFTALGVPHELATDEIAIDGGGPLRPCAVDARGDHRLAMVHAALALALPDQPDPRDPAVAVSWPGFHEKVAELAR